MLTTARLLKEACGDTHYIFRAGAWKARTSPQTYQGAGEEALEWLAEVQHTYGLKVATEVAEPAHVEAAQKAGIDYLWIGARTAANPIAIERIAQAIDPQRIQAVGIKNPVNADPALWIGNIERLEHTGIPVFAIHRGCNHQPCWMMAHAVRTARPDIPILLDPSHMSGDAQRIPELMTKLIDLRLDGAMIEVHTDPASALSDAKQQITPSQLRAVVEPFSNQLREINENETDLLPTSDDTTLNWLRAEIDELDDNLWSTLAARMEVSKRIGEWKKENGIAPLQPERFQQILSKRLTWAAQNGLDPLFVTQLFDIIHQQSLKQQL